MKHGYLWTIGPSETDGLRMLPILEVDAEGAFWISIAKGCKKKRLARER